MALYHKYRPNVFSQLEGQEGTKEILINALRSGNLGHAYLFVGPRGLGKTTTARLLASAVNCPRAKGANACNKCSSCRSIISGSHPDVIEIDAASNRGIDDIREIRSKLDLVPSSAKRKVFIIDEVHMLTREAFNALLKTLEEPPSHLLFILATTEVYKVPATVLSRVQRFDFRKPTVTQLSRYISKIAKQEKIAIAPKAVEKLSQLAEGSYRDGLVLLEQISQAGQKGVINTETITESLGLVRSEYVDELIEFLRTKNLADSIKLLDKLSEAGIDYAHFAHAIIGKLRLKFRKTFDQNYISWLELFATAREQIKYSPEPSLPFELAINKIINQGKGVGEAPKQRAKPKPKSSDKPEPKAIKKGQKKPTSVLTRVATTDTSLKKTPKSGKFSDRKIKPADWEEAIKQLKETSPSLASMLNGSDIKRKPGKITVEVEHQFAKDNLAKQNNRSKLEKALEKTSGARVSLDFVVKNRPKINGGTKKSQGQEIDNIFTIG